MLGDYAGCVSAPAADPAQLGAAVGVPETGRARFVCHPPGAEPAHPLIAAALSIAGGLLLVPAFPGRDVWYLAPLAVAALALAVRGHGAGRAAWLGLLFGWACFIPLLSWSGIYVGRLPWFSLATLQALYVAAMAALMPRVWTAGPPRHRAMSAGLTVLGVSGLWVAQEALRARTPFGGFPWARVAFSQTDSPALGAAAIGGAPAVTALVAAAGGCLAVAMVRLLERRLGPGARRFADPGRRRGAAAPARPGAETGERLELGAGRRGAGQRAARGPGLQRRASRRARQPRPAHRRPRRAGEGRGWPRRPTW